MKNTEQDAPNGTSDSIHGAEFTSASTAKRLELEKVLAMGKGEGNDSYSKNSNLHGFLVKERELPELDRALEHVSLPSHGPVVIVELGCSSGPNAISSVVHIVEKLRVRASQSGSSSSSTEFQAFFNDLPSNDFNNLFELLTRGGKGTLDFVGGVPGSFFGRLFPRSSVHVFFSSMSAHWLSKIPDAILDKNSPAFNKGTVWIRDSSLATDMFKQQAASDLKKFLTARAAELVSGGLLFFVVIGRPELEHQQTMDVDDPLDLVWATLDEVWDDLISQGVLTGEQKDTFNIPLYYRTMDEVMEVVDSCGSDFHVQTAKYVKVDTSYAEIYSTSDPAMFAKKVARMFKALFSSIVEAHIGKDASETFWKLCEPRMEKMAVDMYAIHPDCSMVFPLIALIRK